MGFFWNKKLFDLWQLQRVVNSMKGRGVEPNRVTMMTIVTVVEILGYKNTAVDEGEAEIQKKTKEANQYLAEVPAVKVRVKEAIEDLEVKITWVRNDAERQIKSLQYHSEVAQERANYVQNLIGLLK